MISLGGVESNKSEPFSRKYPVNYHIPTATCVLHAKHMQLNHRHLRCTVAAKAAAVCLSSWKKPFS